MGWGSFPYMAPELWELKSPTVKTDLYALGCLGYELLAGAPPYTGDQAALRAGHLTQAPPAVLDFVPRRHNGRAHACGSTLPPWAVSRAFRDC